jgi:branched-chain amino acid transport system permease protein
MISLANFYSQLFNGLALGVLLALISTGLTIIYGTLGVLNLAHGALFMLGGYAGYVVFQATDSYVVAVIGGTLFVLVVGMALELTLIRRFYRRPAEDQILLTFGIGIVIVELVRLAFGSLSKQVPPPSWLTGVSQLGFMIYPTYRLGVMAIAAVTLFLLYVLLYRTRLGMMVRAGIEDATMVNILGINIYRVFLVVFGIGAMAAGYAGIVDAPVASLTPDMGENILIETFVVVVIGGVGSFFGAIVGGLLAGEILSLTSMLNPAYSQVMLFAVMTLVLVVRPQGLLGVKGRE